MPKSLPVGRGAWIWHLLGANGVAADLAGAVARCKSARLSHVFVDAGSDSLWSQFNKPMVDAFHAAGIQVFGWGYQNTANDEGKAALVKRVHDLGADGYCIDAEKEWERPDADAQAREYVTELQALKLADHFLLAHAPFDVIANHQSFPYTVLGSGVTSSRRRRIGASTA